VGQSSKEESRSIGLPDRIPDWQDRVFSYVVKIVYQIIVAPQGESPNKSSYKICNPLITVALPGKRATTGVRSGQILSIIGLKTGVRSYTDIHQKWQWIVSRKESLCHDITSSSQTFIIR
jgi:hypothetical protein